MADYCRHQMLTGCGGVFIRFIFWGWKKLMNWKCLRGIESVCVCTMKRNEYTRISCVYSLGDDNNSLSQGSPSAWNIDGTLLQGCCRGRTAATNTMFICKTSCVWCIGQQQTRRCTIPGKRCSPSPLHDAQNKWLIIAGHSSAHKYIFRPWNQSFLVPGKH